MSETRIPQILDLQIQGKTKNQIAEKLDVSRMTIWRDRQTDLYTYFLNNWIEKYEEELDDMLMNGTPQYRNEATKEIGRMIRGTKTKQIETKSLNVTADLRASNAWIEHLTPTDFKEFQDMKARALQHMTPTTT